MTIYATCFQNFIGVKRHLQELRQFDVKCISLDQLYKVTNNDTIIFGAWEPNSYPMAIRRCKAKKKALLFTSPLLQAQMNHPELDFLETIFNLKEKKVIDYLLFADEETYEVFKEDNIFHLPHPCDIENIEKVRKVLNKQYPAMGKNEIFCYMPWGNKNKNQITQLAAVKIFQQDNRDVMFYTNGMGYWRKWATKLGLNFEDLGFLPKDKYFKSIYTKGCGLHVTLSESFGYAVLDAFLLGTPILCSPAIYWAFEKVITPNPDDPISIAEDLEYLYDNCTSIGEKCRIRALEVVDKNNKKAKETIGKIIQ